MQSETGILSFSTSPGFRSCIIYNIASTRMALELPQEEVARTFGKWFKSCRGVVESHGGQMNQYLGDGFFCYWEDFHSCSRADSPNSTLPRPAGPPRVGG